MTKRNVSNSKSQLLLLVFIGIIVFASIPLTSEVGADSGRNDSEISKSLIDRIDPQTRAQILKAATQPFEPSLEMKENVDFLLTPALLVQQAISEDVVITYPSE